MPPRPPAGPSDRTDRRGDQRRPGPPNRHAPKAQDNAPRQHARADGRGERPPRGARGGMSASGSTGAANWLYGTHPVVAALENPNRRLRRLLLTEEAEASLAVRLNEPLPLVPERTDRARLDALLGREAVHSGMALLADPLPSPPLDRILERPGPILLLDQVTDPRNVGAILRSAAAFAVAAVIVQDRNAPDETGVLAKAASGALETVPLLRAVNLARTIAALKAAGLWCVGLDAGGGTLDGTAFRQRRVALVLGAEGEGLRRLTRDSCDEIAGLLMPGEMESLNVSNAAAVALYELARGF